MEGVRRRDARVKSPGFVQVTAMSTLSIRATGDHLNNTLLTRNATLYKA